MKIFLKFTGLTTNYFQKFISNITIWHNNKIPLLHSTYKWISLQNKYAAYKG